MPENKMEDLSNIDLMLALKSAERQKVEKACSFKRYDAHEQIIDRQSESTDVYFVILGTVRVVNYSLSGREITLDDMNEGGYFGELSALDGAPRSASVMALTDCLVAALPQEQFLNLLEKHSSISLKVMKSLARIVRTSTDRIMDLSTLAANNRVQADLLRLARNHLDDGNKAEISPIPMHSDIASRASTTRETVARVLNDLARRNVVERLKDSLVVLDVELLSNMVEEVRGE
ncbi:MAG: Crp/Fnr family transcriptional regulator [Proteobacteria bacterium]|nr:Crp/Fnr family transcriptional regulator [Pseudomonadota bacterium]